MHTCTRSIRNVPQAAPATPPLPPHFESAARIQTANTTGSPEGARWMWTSTPACVQVHSGGGKPPSSTAWPNRAPGIPEPRPPNALDRPWCPQSRRQTTPCRFQSEIDHNLTTVLESGQYVMGPMLKRFERELAAYHGSKFAVGVGNGTDAIWLTLMALGISQGDEVITHPNTD